MNIRIPRWLYLAYVSFHGWGYKPIYKIHNFTIRRIDPIIAGMGLFCTAYYGWYGGWTGALAGFLGYVLVAMIAMWL